MSISFYRLRMTWTQDGGGGSLDTRELERFLLITNQIGIGNPIYTTGSELFVRMLQKGDVVMVLAQGTTPLALTRIVDSKATKYISNGSFAGLDNWLKIVRRVEIMSWYHNDKIRLDLPSFTSKFWGQQTFARIINTENLEFVTEWYNKVIQKRFFDNDIQHVSKRYFAPQKKTLSDNMDYKKGANVLSEGGPSAVIEPAKRSAYLEAADNSRFVEEKANLLRNVKNLILTGAPGTGKSFLAKQIAYLITGDNEENSTHIDFCQFHPSYDYTDFVEGLRPTQPDEKGNIGFERHDGIFMSFCRKAIKETIAMPRDNFEEAWKRLVNYLNDNDSISVRTLNGKSLFEVELNECGTGLVSHKYRTKEDRVNGVSVPNHSKYFNHDQLYRVYRGLPGVPDGGHDNYRRAVIDMMRLLFGLQEYKEKVLSESPRNVQDYVFIIDEINRGDIAKIFGELFYAVDPGYRGPKGAIRTQYANLNQDDPIFRDGKLHVPENVHIIGTMNDIDRNVESMDLAIRRRFTWTEIQPEETLDMLYDKKNGIPEYADTAKKVMASINGEIKKSPDLGPEYQLGAAYFLKLKDYRGNFSMLWENNVKPLLKEYFRNRPKAKEMIDTLYGVWRKALSEAPEQ